MRALNSLSGVLSRIQEIESRFSSQRADTSSQDFAQVLKAAQTGNDVGNSQSVVAAGNSGASQARSTDATATKSVMSFAKSDAYSTLIQESAQKYQLEPNLIKAVIAVESNFNPGARSSAGAMGLMQLMPGTARGLGVTDPYDPAQNIEGGSKFLKQMIDGFGDVRLALAAYNAGPGNVKKYGGIPPFAETRKYVEKVMAAWESFWK